MYSYKQNKYELKKSKILKYNNFSENNLKKNIKTTTNKNTMDEKINNKTQQIEILNKYFIGTQNIVFSKNNFNSNKYFFEYDNLYMIPISEHIFLTIKKINWSLIDVHINMNGDLVSKMYMSVKLPSLSVEYDDKKKIVDYIKLHVYTDDEIDFNTYVFSKYLKELYIEFENFNFDLKNLPEGLKLLSICSKIFNLELTNLPTNLEYLYINSNCFDSYLTNLPERLKVLSIVTSNLTIKLDNLPQGLKILHINSSIIKNPEIFSYLPDSLEYLYIQSNNLENINLSDLPTGLKVLSIRINKSLDRNIESNLPKKIIQLDIVDGIPLHNNTI